MWTQVLRTGKLSNGIIHLYVSMLLYSTDRILLHAIELQVKDIYLHPDPFSVQNGLLTPALKLRRPQVKNYFKPQLEDMYNHLD